MTKIAIMTTFIGIYLIGVVSGMYIASQIEKHIDKRITKKNNNGN
tara:strand:- start:68 stop:202 length:135 start_codon:yes stop_codon:yes gene_type:complete